MQWGSAAEFFAMGGYGMYVWGAYFVTAALITTELVVLVRRGRTPRGYSGRSPKAANRTQ